MTFNKSLFSSLRGDWETPDELYQELDNEFHFNFDPCPHNPDFDGLSIAWKESNFINPPYNRAITDWLIKALHENKLSVFLLPSRTDTRWFQDIVLPYSSEIRFIRGRLKFKGAENGAPFPSVICVFRQREIGIEIVREKRDSTIKKHFSFE